MWGELAQVILQMTVEHSLIQSVNKSILYLQERCGARYYLQFCFDFEVLQVSSSIVIFSSHPHGLL